MKFEFTTSEYKFENGKAPKGYGYWMFEAEGYEYGTPGTYTDAKKKAKEYFKSIAPKDYVGTVRINVMP